MLESLSKRDILAAQSRLVELLSADFDVAIGPENTLVVTNPKLTGKVKTYPLDFLDLDGETQLEVEASCVKWFADNFDLKVTADADYSETRWPRMVVTFQNLDDALRGMLCYNNYSGVTLAELAPFNNFSDDDPAISDINSLQPA